MDKHYDKHIVTEPVGAPVPVITLRDYLAAAALQGMLATETNDRMFVAKQTVAAKAYSWADAMLAVREEK